MASSLSNREKTSDRSTAKMKQNCNTPAFLSKLWTLVEDHSTSDLICWSQDGCSFIVCEEQRFSKEVLPLYFKHSNMTSFVRQLNMYGFRKVVQVEAGLLLAAGQGGGGVEFQHPYFRRTQPHLLEFIRRKVSVSRGGEEGVSPVSRVLLDLSQVRGWQDGSDCKLMALCRENESLGHELDTLRQKYQQHHRIIRKIIRFIANTVQSNGITGLKRKLPLLIDTSGISHSPPKYSRTLSVQDSMGASPLHGISLDFAGGSLYPNGMIISDVTELLELQGGAWEDGRSLSEGTFDPVLSPPSTPTFELDLSLLESSETGESATDRSEACDPLALIDSGLAALSPPLTPSPGPSLDLLTELFNPQPCSPGGDSQTETLKESSGMGDQARKRTASQTGTSMREIPDRASRPPCTCHYELCATVVISLQLPRSTGDPSIEVRVRMRRARKARISCPAFYGWPRKRLTLRTAKWDCVRRRCSLI